MNHQLQSSPIGIAQVAIHVFFIEELIAGKSARMWSIAIRIEEPRSRGTERSIGEALYRTDLKPSRVEVRHDGRLPKALPLGQRNMRGDTQAQLARMVEFLISPDNLHHRLRTMAAEHAHVLQAGHLSKSSRRRDLHLFGGRGYDRDVRHYACRDLSDHGRLYRNTARRGDGMAVSAHPPVAAPLRQKNF